MKKLFFTLLLCSTTATLHAQHLEPAAAADDDQAYQLVFSDEFDQPDGSAPDPAKWRCSTRYSATWCRWISDSPDVAYIKNGRLVCRAIPNPDTTRDNVPMITGAVETQGKFSFTYGKVEVRLRTNIQNGNFPAAWMMPQPPCDGWPRGGEIDIFESIDNQQRAYHTVHSHWTYDLGHKSDPQHSFSESVKVNEWHVYGLIWTETELRWTLARTVALRPPLLHHPQPERRRRLLGQGRQHLPDLHHLLRLRPRLSARARPHHLPARRHPHLTEPFKNH